MATQTFILEDNNWTIQTQRFHCMFEGFFCFLFQILEWWGVGTLTDSFLASKNIMQYDYIPSESCKHWGLRGVASIGLEVRGELWVASKDRVLYEAHRQVDGMWRSCNGIPDATYAASGPRLLICPVSNLSRLMKILLVSLSFRFYTFQRVFCFQLCHDMRFVLIEFFSRFKINLINQKLLNEISFSLKWNRCLTLFVPKKMISNTTSCSNQSRAKHFWTVTIQC